MISKTRLSSAIFAASIVALVAAPSFAADTQIKVTETGEGGGAMGLVLEPATVKAGPAMFHVHNAAMSEDHEMIVVKLDKPDAAIPLDSKKHRIDEKKLKSLGEVSDLKPGADGTLKANLKAGTYLVFCNIKGHYEAGMQNKLVVTP